MIATGRVSMPKKFVVIVEDNRDVCAVLTRSIQQAGFASRVCFTPEEAIAEIDSGCVLGVVTKIHIGSLSGGRRVYARAKELSLPVVVFVGSVGEDEKIPTDDIVLRPRYKKAIGALKTRIEAKTAETK